MIGIIIRYLVKKPVSTLDPCVFRSNECVLDWPVYDKTVIEDNAELYYKAGENFPYNCSADYMNNNNQICLASGLWRQTRPLCAVNCSFEIPCPVFEHTSVRQFTRRNGSTPSVETGCSEDHTTGTDGYYYYLEASGIPIGYQFTMTTASPFPTGHPICIHLWYHMNGRNMGSLHIVLQNQYGAMSNITIAEGSQGDTWKQWSATLEAQASQVWLSIVGVCGNNFRSDICLDDIEMYIC
ncbi:thyroid hormone-induced protein B-like [Argopecten irradians]|uniref:thyroid hormone-induced protein B-like n=1 Tax=Argopecten irradians TaxID=31199 RepID=UPI0037148816